MPRTPIDLTGYRSGRLVALRDTGDKRNGQRMWLCACDCGNETTVRAHPLKFRKIRSCGCLVVEVGKNNRTHGLTRHPLYQVWRGMMKRCYDPNWKDFDIYGGRGIDVCERWHEVAVFVEDVESGYEPNLSLERIDGNSGYSPTNCKWATPLEQANNKRNNRLITFDGRTQTLQQWSRETGIHYRTINSRLDLMKWPVPKALTTPARPTGR